MYYAAFLTWAALCLVVFSPVAAKDRVSEPLKTVYTSLETKNCKAQKSGGDDGYFGRCKGVGGYQLELLEGDLRQTINVIDPKKKKTELNLWHSVSSGFSTIGDKAEWRVSGEGKAEIPRALIVRFNASENPEDSTKITSYLVVIKISAAETCVTDIIKPKKKQNEEARELSNTATSRACYQKPE